MPVWSDTHTKQLETAVPCGSSSASCCPGGNAGGRGRSSGTTDVPHTHRQGTWIVREYVKMRALQQGCLSLLHFRWEELGRPENWRYAKEGTCSSSSVNARSPLLVTHTALLTLCPYAHPKSMRCMLLQRSMLVDRLLLYHIRTSFSGATQHVIAWNV